MPKPRKDTLFALSVLIKGLILIVSLWFIYHYLFVINDFRVFVELTNKALSSGISILSLFAVVILMILNWVLEALKWKILIHKVHQHTLIDSIKVILVGTSIGLFTPNRIGELGGRLLFLNNENRISGVVMAGIGSLSQLLFTILFGIIGFLFLFIKGYLVVGKSHGIIYALSGVILTGLTLFFFQRPLRNLMTKLFKKDYTLALNEMNRMELSQILTLSCLRYLVFCLQFYILLNIFEVNLSLFTALFFISVTFLAITVIPSFALADIGVRGAVSVFFIGLFSTNYAGIIAASISLWLINIAVPALIGNAILIKHRLLTRLK